MSPALVVATVGTADSTPQGARHRLFAKLCTCHQNFSSDTYQGSTAVNITATSNQLGRKMRQEFRQKKFGSLQCQKPGNHNTIIEVMSKSTNSGMTLSIIGKVAAGRKVYVSLGSRSN
jgi:hypothetical protein